MADSYHQLHTEISELRGQIDSLRQISEAILRATSRDLLDDLLLQMHRDPILLQVFRLVDGQRSQADILDALKDQDARGASSPTVSRKIDVLQNELGLIEFVVRSARGKVYRQTQLSRILGLSRRFQQT